MAYVPIILNKLKYTYGGHDYDLQPVQIAYINNLVGTYAGSAYNFRNWLAANAETNNSFSVTGYDTDASGRENKAKIIATLNVSALNIYPIFQALSVGSELYFWREDVGRNVRWVWKKDTTTQWRTGSYVYGTYTWGNRVAAPSISYGKWSAPTQNIGFLYNESNGRYHWWQNRFYSNDSAHGYNSNPVYFEAGCDYYWAAYGAALTILCTGNIYNPPAPPATDEPYGGDDYDESSGGNGDHDDESDTITQSALPVAAATRTGMCTAYVPTWGEIKDVASALLDPNIFQILAQNVVKLSDVVIGLSVFPCAISATDTGTVKANVLGVEIGTGVVCHIADDQYVEFDCGSLTIDEYWGNCLDYNPYTRISIFLPFCGMYELDTDEVMGRTLNVSYRVDIFSGACLATIKIDSSVFYQYSGQCSSQVPLSSVSFDSFLGSMLDIGIATATGVGAVGAAGAAVSQAKGEFGIARKKGAISASKNVAESVDNYNKVKEQSGNAIADAAVGAVVGSKGFYQHAGAMSGSPGFLGVRYPYIIIKRPEQIIPRMYGKYHGFPANTSAVLGDLVGYTEVNDIRLNIPEATVDEIIECEQLLKGGVVI